MLRDAFFLPEPKQAIELRAFTHGLMPRSAPSMMAHFTTDWRTHGVDAWNEVHNHWLPESGEPVGWWSLPAYLGDRFIAPLLGAPAETCIMQPNAHWVAQALITSPEVFAAKRKVVLSEGEFPSVRFSLSQWAETLALEIHEIALENGRVNQDALLEAIDDQTALVILSHVGFTTGEKLTDAFLRRIAAEVHKAGGLFALDGYHSIGAMTSSVTELNVDVYFGGLLKEASGSSGNAFVYIRPGLELTPRITGWFGDRHPFDFRNRPTAHQEVRRRFLGGTTAIASLYHAVEGVRLLLREGLPTIREDSLNKTQYSISLADRIGLPLRSPRQPESRSAMLIFEVERADLLSQYLKTQHIYTDSRQNRYLRMAPWVWNTHDELTRTFAGIQQALESRVYLEINSTKTNGPVT